MTTLLWLKRLAFWRTIRTRKPSPEFNWLVQQGFATVEPNAFGFDYRVTADGIARVTR